MDSTRTQELLRGAKAASAHAQTLLDDPDAAALIRHIEQRVRDAQERGDVDDAKAHATELSALLDAYELLHEKMGVCDEAEREAVAIILDERGHG